MYQLVPINNGVLDIDYNDICEGITLSPTQAIVRLKDNAQVRGTWISQTIDQWHAAFNTGTVTANKTTITANGTDSATITATVPASLTSVTFYNANTNAVIGTSTVTNQTATISITSTTPKTIPVRVGDFLMTQENKIIIQAQ